jgi:DNA-binding MltR family transcriptional regulator
MAEKQESPSLSSFREAAATFEKESDRGSALIAVAWVDDALEACLRSRFRDEKTIVDSLLRQDGPLGSFSSRIKTAYLLGLITASLYSDLERMRGIRNAFAHVRRRVRFKDQSIKDRCKSLHGAKAFEEGTGNLIRSHRQRFLLSAFFAAECLLSYAEKPKRPKTPLLDFYPVVVRRMGKSVGLQQLMTALDKFENRADS